MLDASKQSSQVKHMFQHQSMSITDNSPSISRSFSSSQVSSSKIRRAWILGCDAMEALHIDYMWCWVLHLGMCHKHLSMAVHWYGMYIFVYIQCSTPSTYNSLQKSTADAYDFLHFYTCFFHPNLQAFFGPQLCILNFSALPGQSNNVSWRAITRKRLAFGDPTWSDDVVGTVERHHGQQQNLA